MLGLKQLNILDLSDNKITKIPGDISRLQATELVLNRNQVRTVCRIKAYELTIEDCLTFRSFRLPRRLASVPN